MLNNTLIIGVDIGGTRTKYGLVDIAKGKVLQTMVLPTEKKDGTLFLQQLDKVISQFKNFAAISSTEVTAIGFGIPGFTKQGEVVTTYGFLDFMENYPIKNIIQKEFGIPCFIDNDARAVSLGEALYGKGKNFSRVLTLTLGTGVGFGMVVNGKFGNDLPLAHMGGHMKVTENSVLCYCGKAGCLEALVCAAAIVNLAEQKGLANVTSAEAVFDAATNGDQKAVALIEEVTGYLHTAIHNYINLFAPDIIVLGGGVAKGLLPYLNIIKGESYLAPYPNYKFELVVSELEELAGMLGSAALYQTQNAGNEC